LKPFLQRVAMARRRQRKIILRVTTFATEIKSFSSLKVLQLPQNFLAKSNLLNNIHEAKSLQPITAFNEFKKVLKLFYFACKHAHI